MKFPTILAVYLDREINFKLKGNYLNQIEEKFTKIINVFKYLYSKDIFVF